jgi:DNA-binding transcriptional regulator YbjK
VFYREFGVMFCDVIAGFANHFQVADHSISGFAVSQLRSQVHACGVFLNAVDRLDDVMQVIRNS